MEAIEPDVPTSVHLDLRIPFEEIPALAEQIGGAISSLAVQCVQETPACLSCLAGCVISPRASGVLLPVRLQLRRPELRPGEAARGSRQHRYHRHREGCGRQRDPGVRAARLRLADQPR